MPTGYTAPIADGITFEKFALSCARAFGVLFTMRDEPNDAPIPESFEPSDYNAKWLAEAQERRARLLAMTALVCETAADAAYQEALQRWEKRRQQHIDLKAKYSAMLVKSQAWTPPTAEHQGLKDFMIAQINESIRFDCSVDYDTKPVALSPGMWKTQQLEQADHDIAYHTREHEKELQRTNGRTAWIAALRESLAGSPPQELK